MKAARIILLLLVWHTSFSQWTDNFDDGDFNLNPSWTGNTADFIVENGTLKLSAPAVSGSAYLSTPSGAIVDASWQFSVQLDFNPSSSNYVKIYLVANNGNLNEELQGYFVKIGGLTDEVSLYRQDGLAEEEIIDGLDGRLSLTVVNVEILASRSAEGQWQLSSKLTSEQDWYLEGNALDFNYNQSAYFGISCIYTATRSTKFYFDNFNVTGTPIVDNLSPYVDTVYTTGTNTVILMMSEPIENTSALTHSNYLLNNLTEPISVESSFKSITLVFNDALAVINTLNITSIKDVAQNVMADTLVQFIYLDPGPVETGDIIINEFMADPSPREDLPEVEYVELHNVSHKAINMTEWSFSDKISRGILKSAIILPDSFLILCSKPDVAIMQQFGNVQGLTPWPSLNNSGDSLSIITGQGEMIDFIVYDNSWYNDDSKQNGGWSLERINPEHPCSGYLNWQASTNTAGGTPGSENSVLITRDSSPPEIIKFEVALDNVIVTFNEPLSSTLGTISITPANSVLATTVNYNQLVIYTSQPFTSGQSNEVILSSVADCYNNITENLSVSFIPDFDAPKIDTVFSDYPGLLEVYFDEIILTPIADNFQIEFIGLPSSLEHDPSNLSHLSLNFSNRLSSGDNYTLIADAVSDIFGNMTIRSQYSFNYLPLKYPEFSEVLITEIMADPSPSVNLPEYEYIELTNTTPKRLLLKSLILADAKDMVTIPTGIIEARERVILTKTSAVQAFAEYGNTFGIPNWPTLNNSADQITLLDSDLKVIHHIGYTNAWYKDEEKKDGGWSLELIDEASFCSGAKVWAASIDILGGTPGTINSIQSTLPDLTIPLITEAIAVKADSILIRFNESLTNQLPDISTQSTTILDYDFTSFGRNEIFLKVEPLQPTKKYEFIVTRILDCSGNINNEARVEVILPEEAIQGDIVISEILFNPRKNGVDFIEIYNNSPKYISLLKWQIANEASSVEISMAKVLPPYSFRVFTSIPEVLITEYAKAIVDNIYVLNLPSFPNQQGKIIILNSQSYLHDSLNYDEEWHFPYLANVEGVSLERISYDQPADQASNWASASSTENYATPGYRNSQSVSVTNSSVLSISPRVIIPNANGIDDFTTISLNQPGSVASITIYNLQGQIVKNVIKNALVGSSSIYTWDGTDYNGARVSLGHYIVVVEVFSASGSTQTFRQKVVVGTGF